MSVLKPTTSALLKRSHRLRQAMAIGVRRSGYFGGTHKARKVAADKIKALRKSEGPKAALKAYREQADSYAKRYKVK